MKFWAVIPVKPLRRGKSRLSDVLTEDEREQLNKNLLSHTLKVLSEVPEIEQTLVISRDTKALAIARKFGAKTVQEDGTPHLNIALNRAVAIATSGNTTRAVLVLPADLPQLSKEDVHALLKHASKAPVMVISPDHLRKGTNALLLNPAGIFNYDFGGASFDRHIAQAKELNISVEICELSTVAKDLDLPEDLDFLNGEVDNWLIHEDETEDQSDASAESYERMP